MSDVITQSCAVCGTLKTAANCTTASPWIRVPWMTLGNSAQPIQVFRPNMPGQPRFPGLNQNALDFCPTCAPKTTVDKLPGLLAAKSVPTK
jgi:hypothetical protein